ncbi:MAG: hypothetical protein E5W20_03040, partial [Mesorhizobium sp.]
VRQLQSQCQGGGQGDGQSPAGLFGYSHLVGGYWGGQAEYLRVPFADVGPIKVPDGLDDEQVLFLSDIFPTGYMVDKVKAAVYLGTDRPHVLREAIYCCRKGGTVSVPGVYVGLLDHIPFGAAMNKGLTFRMGQTHTQRYLEPLLAKVQEGEIDPSFVITHRADLDAGPDLYKT